MIIHKYIIDLELTFVPDIIATVICVYQSSEIKKIGIDINISFLS